MFDFQLGDVMAFFADPGWIVSHTYTVYGALSSGSTSFLYDGSLRGKKIGECKGDLTTFLLVFFCHKVQFLIPFILGLLFTSFLPSIFSLSVQVGYGT